MAGEAEDAFDRIQKLFQETILREYPNPERRGCRGSEELKRIASHDAPPTSDPAWEHTIRCAPCYTEFLDYRRQYKGERRRARVRWRYALASAATASAVCLALIFLWRPSSGAFTTTYRDISAVRNFRGAEQSVQTDLSLPADNLDLTLRLPVGSSEGSYSVLVLLEPGSTALVTGTGNAHITNGSTMLHLKIKLARLKPGVYYLDFRRDRWDWLLLTCRLVAPS